MMSRRSSILALVAGFFIICYSFNCTYAATVKIADYGDGTASLTNATSAYNAASPGDTILFPMNGSATWSSSLTVRKAVIINGNGSTLTAGTSLSNGFFYVTGFTDDLKMMRITGFIFNSDNNTGGRRAIAVVNVTLGKLRIDHNTFNFGYTQVEVGGAFGVIDHNSFINGYNFLYMTAGTRAQADASWVNLTPGTANALFVEDNKFIIDANSVNAPNGNGVDAYNGGKIVFRYNEFNYDAATYTGNLSTIGFHGSAAGGCNNGYWQQTSSLCRRSPSVVEIYNNNFHGRRIDYMFALRGGSALIYSNTHIDNYGGRARIIFREEEYYESSNWTPLRVAWPAEDQIHNTFIWDNIIDGVAQSSSNIYVDDYNRRCVSASTPYACCTGSLIGTCNNWQANAFLAQDRDFFLHRPATVGEGMTLGKAVFTGANGASKTYPTDGNIYPTFGSMNFLSGVENAYYGYTHYSYPHPLIATSPTPPEGLKLNTQ